MDKIVTGNNLRYDGPFGEVYKSTDRKIAKVVLGGFVGAFLGGVIAISGAAYEMGRLTGNRENPTDNGKESKLEYEIDKVLAPVILGIGIAGFSFLASVVYGTRTIIDHVHECNEITWKQEMGGGI